MNKILKTMLACCLIAVIAGMQSCKPREVEPEYVGMAVDLGLSVKWAQTNVGAVKREDVGSYFAWGETEKKDSYTDENYKWLNSNGRLTKYCTSSHMGKPDGLTVLEPADDAATAALGEGWRTPTLKEMKELIEKCTWTWADLNGCKGYMVRSKVEGFADKYIFLPAAGVYDTVAPAVNYIGSYWTAETPDYTGETTIHLDSYMLDFQNSFVNTSNAMRFDGLTIRPVYTK